jgi:hypothetical protein
MVLPTPPGVSMKITNKAGDRKSIRLVYLYESHTDENGKTTVTGAYSARWLN